MKITAILPNIYIYFAWGKIYPFPTSNAKKTSALTSDNFKTDGRLRAFGAHPRQF